MNCVRVKPKGKKGCQKGIATQQTCSRRGKVTRKTGPGKFVTLCAKCDKEFGDKVGILCYPCALCGKPTVVMGWVRPKGKRRYTWDWECDECFSGPKPKGE